MFGSARLYPALFVAAALVAASVSLHAQEFSELCPKADAQKSVTDVWVLQPITFSARK